MGRDIISQSLTNEGNLDLKFNEKLNENAFKMFNELMKNRANDKNLVFSPYSLQQMLDFIAQKTSSRKYLSWTEQFIEKGISDEELGNTKTDKKLEIDGDKISLTTTADYGAEWCSPFDVSITAKKDFSTESGATVKVSTMMKTFSQKEIKYEITPEHEIVCLPCEDNSLVCFIKPNGNQPSTYAQRLKRVLEWFNSERSSIREKLELALPKINKLEDNFDLKTLLRNIGLRSFFDGTLVFDKMGNFDGVTLEKAEQKTTINIDEKGAKATAWTGFQFYTIGISPVTMVIRIRMDSPYFIVIADKVKTSDTYRTVFIAYIANPSKI
jgi:serine protease inhibitor